MIAKILGLGQMGEATCWAMKQLGYYVHGVDSDLGKVERLTDNGYMDCGSCGGDSIIRWINQEDDIVISCLPYMFNYEVANHCISHGLRYIDLGGSVPVEERIIDLANRHTKASVFTGLGVAPGLISILGLKAMAEFPCTPDDMLLAVGGLHYSDEHNFPTYYQSNWSKQGLLNEYFDSCLILENSKIEKVDGLSGFQNIVCEQETDNEPNLLEYECFRTSGGLSSMLDITKDYGIKNCEYKTIRYAGHYEFLQYLQNTLNLNKEEIGKILNKSCVETTPWAEYIILHIELSKGNLKYKKNWFVYTNKEFSAMQQTTAFTLASVADLMARNVIVSKVCTYKDVFLNFEEFNNNLQKLGLSV